MRKVELESNDSESREFLRLPLVLHRTGLGRSTIGSTSDQHQSRGAL